MPQIFYKRLSTATRKEIVRFFISLFFAWTAAILLIDIPAVRSFLVQTQFDFYIQENLIFLTTKILNVFGFSTFSQGNFIKTEGTPGVIIAFGCLGIRHFVLLIVFVSTYFGRWWHKVWYIVSGCLLLFISNVIRILTLCLTQYYWPERMDLIHESGAYIFQWFVILLLWIIWIDRFGRYTPGSKDPSI